MAANSLLGRHREFCEKPILKSFSRTLFTVVVPSPFPWTQRHWCFSFELFDKPSWNDNKCHYFDWFLWSHAAALNAVTSPWLVGGLLSWCRGDLRDPGSNAASADPLNPLISLKPNHLPHLHVEGLGLHPSSCMKVRSASRGPGYFHLWCRLTATFL